MVRLKVDTHLWLYQINVFQFHYGTIKSQALLALSSSFLQFQFHYGTIKSSMNHDSALADSLISIPLWYD